MKIPNHKNYFFIVLVFLCCACSNKEIFSEFHSFPSSVWDKDNIVQFEVAVTDTISYHDVVIEVRSNDDYQFRNLWLFVNFKTPDGKVRSDTINGELADMYGKWHGKGISLYTLPLPFEQSVMYPVSGTYTYSIRQGMRENPLKGISDIGLRISKQAN